MQQRTRLVEETQDIWDLGPKAATSTIGDSERGTLPCLRSVVIVKSGVQAGWSLRIIPAFEFYLHSFLSLFP